MKKVISLLVTLSMIIGVIPIIGHAEAAEYINDSRTLKSEIITDSDVQVDNYSYEKRIIEEEAQNSNIIDSANIAYDVLLQESTYVNADDDFDRLKARTLNDNWESFNALRTVDVQLGDYTILTLKEDGTVWRWGKNIYNQNDSTDDMINTYGIQQVPGLENIIKISLQDSYMMALDSSGCIYGWKNSNNDVPKKLRNIQDAVEISAGKYDSSEFLVLKNDGTVWSCKSDGSTKCVTGLTDINKISVHSTLNLALKNDGTIWGWNSEKSPKKCTGISDVKSILADDTCIAVKNDGTVYSFVYDIRAENYISKITDLGLSNVKDVFRDETFLKEDGTVWRKGRNNFGQLGNGTQNDSDTYVRANVPNKVKTIASDSQTIIALDEFGNLWGWGVNHEGEIIRPRIESHMYPEKIANLSKVKDIHANLHTSLFLKEDGTAWGLGSNSYAIINKEKGYGFSVPAQLDISDISHVECDQEHSIALKKDGTLWGWGANRFGQTGLSSYTLKTEVPTQIDIENVKDFSSCFTCTAAIKEDGTVWAWGNFGGGSSATPTQVNNLDNVIQVEALEGGCLALKDDGTLWAWNSSLINEENITPIQIRSLYNVTKIDGILALCEDGTVYQINNNYTSGSYTLQHISLSNVKNIGHGWNCQFAVKEDGTVWAWGSMRWPGIGYDTKNTPTQIEGLQNIVACAGGLGHNVALDSDGYVWTWGSNAYGELGYGDVLLSTVPVKIDGTECQVITSVTTDPSVIEVEYGTTADALDAQLPTQATVTLDNNQPKVLNITEWDKSGYIADVPGEYTVYGTIETTDGIINPYNKQAEVTVKVGEKPPTTHPIESIKPIQISADQSVPLEQEGLEHALGVPVTVPLPKTVEATLDDGTTAELNVTLWHIDSYNPHQTGKQTILGDVELKDGIENPKNLPAMLEITVIPTEYEIVEASPQKISVDILAGTPKDKILEKIEQKTIDVDVLNAETSEEIYIYTGFTFSDEYAENLAYNPNQLGKQILIGRFYSNFLDTIEPPCVEVEVNVVSSEIASVTEEHVNAYQCMPFDSIEDLPQKVTVNLENGMTEKVDVEWNSGNYEKGLAGDQIITGNLVNLPTGVIQPEEEKTAVLIVHVQPVSYKVTAITPDEDFFETDKDGNELYAGFTLAELREKLPVDKVKVQLTSVTENVNILTEYELDFTLEEENNTIYTPEDEFCDNLYGTLVVPENITNPDNLMYEFMVKTNAVEITEIEPVSVMAEYYTEFNDIVLPDTVYAKLTNGQRKPIDVTWNSDGYNPDPEELTEDNPVVFNLSGTLCNIPQYINHYDTDIPQLTITLVLPRVYKITDIAPVRIPETGTKKINLGSSLSDIYDLIENHTATVTLENLKGVTSTQEVTFTLREDDNGHYDPMSEEEFELTAYLNLPEGIENPDNKQLVISVRPTKYTIRTTVASRVNGVQKGTPFVEITMPDKVTVNYTDTEIKQGEVLVASWDGSKYNPEKIGNQAIKGTFPDPLPVYVTNPNNRTPSAIVNVVDSTTTILSAKQVTEETPFSAIKKSIRKTITQTKEIDGYIERKYEVELLHEDGSITTEMVSIFDEMEE